MKYPAHRPEEKFSVLTSILDRLDPEIDLIPKSKEAYFALYGRGFLSRMWMRYVFIRMHPIEYERRYDEYRALFYEALREVSPIKFVTLM